MKYSVATCLVAIAVMGVIPVFAAPEYGPITDGLQMSAQPDKSIYHAGDPVRLVITIHNTGTQMAVLGGSAFDISSFSFTLKDARGLIQPLTPYGKQLLMPPSAVFKNALVGVPPRGDTRYRFVLSQLYDLTLAGDYTLVVHRDIPRVLYKPDGKEIDKVVSDDLVSSTVSLRIPEDAASYSGPMPVSTPPKMREYVYLISTFGVRDQAHGVVSQYQVDADGTLSPVTPFIVPVGNYAREIVTVPNRPYAYVANRGDGTISQFRISASGALVPLSPPTLQTGSQPQSLAIDPAGHFLYFSSGNDGAQCHIGSDGQLALLTKSKSPVPTVFHPTGRFAYATGWSAYQYQVDTDGRLLPLSPTYVRTGDSSNPGPMTIDPSGKYVYTLTLRAVAYKNAVPSQYTDYIAQFKIGTDGTLSALSLKGLDCNGFQTQFLAADPTGRFVYAGLGFNQVAGYRITRSGSLAPLAPTVLRGLLDPQSIAFEHSGRFAYIASDHTNSIAQFKIGPDGDLLPLALDIGSGGVECSSLASANVPAPSEMGSVTGGLQLAARLDQSGFRSGQPIALTVVARNLTNKPLSLGKQHDLLAGFTIIAQTDAGEALPLTLYGEAAGHQSADTKGPALMIAPKSQRQFRFLLTRLFRFATPGPYTIRVQRRVQQRGDNATLLISNTLHLDVNSPVPDSYYFDSLSAADRDASGYGSEQWADYEVTPFP